MSLAIILCREDRYKCQQLVTKLPAWFHLWQHCTINTAPSTLLCLSTSRSLKPCHKLFLVPYQAVVTAVLPAMGYKCHPPQYKLCFLNHQQLSKSYLLFILEEEQQKLLLPTIYKVTSIWPSSNPGQKYLK